MSGVAPDEFIIDQVLLSNDLGKKHWFSQLFGICTCLKWVVGQNCGLGDADSFLIFSKFVLNFHFFKANYWESPQRQRCPVQVDFRIRSAFLLVLESACSCFLLPERITGMDRYCLGAFGPSGSPAL